MDYFFSGKKQKSKSCANPQTKTYAKKQPLLLRIIPAWQNAS
jgi:hypothetical protein